MKKSVLCSRAALILSRMKRPRCSAPPAGRRDWITAKPQRQQKRESHALGTRSILAAICGHTLDWMPVTEEMLRGAEKSPKNESKSASDFPHHCLRKRHMFAGYQLSPLRLTTPPRGRGKGKEKNFQK